MDSSFLSYGKEKESRSRAGFTTPFGVCERNVAMKEKIPLHTWMKQRWEFDNKKMWLLCPGKCHDYRVLHVSIPSGRLPSN
jgi:hypothetical protein